MKYIDHHAHMVSRTTDDYQQMALTGLRRGHRAGVLGRLGSQHADGFEDYFRQLTDFEPKRAAQYRIQHYAWLGDEPEGSRTTASCRARCCERIPTFLDRPTVLGIGEIGLNRVTRNEIATYTEQIELALAHRQLVLIHTPHLEDKHKGTRISVDVLRQLSGRSSRSACWSITPRSTRIEMILEHGYWAGLTLYPQTKVSPQRAADMIEQYGPDRICVAGACDWGPSDPIAVPRFVMEMRRRKHSGGAHPPGRVREPGAVPGQSPQVRAAGRASSASRRGRLRHRLAGSSCRHRAARSARAASTSPTAPTSMPADGWDGGRSPTSDATRRR